MAFFDRRQPSETVIDLYRRHAAQWQAARRRAQCSDRVWIEAYYDALIAERRLAGLRAELQSSARS